MGLFADIEIAKSRMLALEREFHGEVKKIPLGACVTWRRGGYPQNGTVLLHGGGGRLFVKNNKTGAEFWLEAEKIVGC